MTAVADLESKNRDIRKWKKEAGELKNSLIQLSEMNENKEKKIIELSKEVTKLKRQQKESDLKMREMKEYAQEMEKKAKNFFGRYDQEKVLKEIKDLIKENEDVKCIARELKSEIEYGKQRENKLMYFLFLMQQKNYPVFEIFEDHIKDLPTARFSTNLDDKFKEIYMEQKKKMKDMGLIGDFDFAITERAQKLSKLDKETEMSFLSEESYEPINAGPAPNMSKPLNVPALNFDLMNQNLQKEKKQKERNQEAKRRRKTAGSDPGRLTKSEQESELLLQMPEVINHNKYAKNVKYVEEESYGEVPDPMGQEYVCKLQSEQEDLESSP